MLGSYFLMRTETLLWPASLQEAYYKDTGVVYETEEPWTQLGLLAKECETLKSSGAVGMCLCLTSFLVRWLLFSPSLGQVPQLLVFSASWAFLFVLGTWQHDHQVRNYHRVHTGFHWHAVYFQRRNPIGFLRVLVQSAMTRDKGHWLSAILGRIVRTHLNNSIGWLGMPGFFSET